MAPWAMSVALNAFPHTRLAYSGTESHWVSLAAVEWTLEKVSSGRLMKTPTVSLTKAELASWYIRVRSSRRVSLGVAMSLRRPRRLRSPAHSGARSTWVNKPVSRLWAWLWKSISAPVRARGLSAKSHRARVAISCSFLREVLIRSVTSKPSGWAGSRTYTVRPRPSRRWPRTSGTISVEGSKQTMGPAQVRAVGITEPVVLNPPDPAKIRQCDPPNEPSKVRSGGVAPLPQVDRSRGLNGRAGTTSRSTR